MKKTVALARPGKPKTWIITALLASLAVAYVIFVFVPCQRSIGQLQSQVHERQQQIMHAQSLTRPLIQARERLTQTRDVCRQWRDESPRPTELISHIASMTRQAEAAGVAIERLDPLPAADMKVVAQQNVTIQFHGAFQQTFELMRRLESLPGTLWVRDLRLAAPNESDNQLHGELTLTIFVDRAVYAD
jgi:Tfp pilus assembly protein PilO